MFMDEFTLFEQGTAANVWGLLSNVAHWKEFETDMGVDNVGVYPMPSPTVAADQHEGAPGVPLDGGVGYGVNKDSPNIDLARRCGEDPRFAGSAVSTSSTTPASVPANTEVDTSGIDSPGLKQIMGWLATRAVPTTHANSSAAELDEWHRQSQAAAQRRHHRRRRRRRSGQGPGRKPSRRSNRSPNVGSAAGAPHLFCPVTCP